MGLCSYAVCCSAVLVHNNAQNNAYERIVSYDWMCTVRFDGYNINDLYGVGVVICSVCIFMCAPF